MTSVLSNRWLKVLGILLGVSGSSSAQTSRPPVILSVDGALVFQYASLEQSSYKSSFRLGVNFDHWKSADVGYFGRATLDVAGPFGGEDAIFVPPTDPFAPAQPSRPQFQGLDGGALQIGGMVGRAETLQLRASVGAGAYENDGGGFQGALVGEADAAFFPFKMAGVFAGGRFIRIPHYFGERLDVSSLILGIRLH
jgi:hypothetical protein